jgi:hypothetical protein
MVKYNFVLTDCHLGHVAVNFYDSETVHAEAWMTKDIKKPKMYQDKAYICNQIKYPQENHRPLKEKTFLRKNLFYQKSKLPLLAFQLAASQEDDLAVRRLARQGKSYPTRGCGALGIVPETDD